MMCSFKGLIFKLAALFLKTIYLIVDLCFVLLQWILISDFLYKLSEIPKIMNLNLIILRSGFRCILTNKTWRQILLSIVAYMYFPLLQWWWTRKSTFGSRTRLASGARTSSSRSCGRRWWRATGASSEPWCSHKLRAGFDNNCVLL